MTFLTDFSTRTENVPAVVRRGPRVALAFCAAALAVVVAGCAAPGSTPSGEAPQTAAGTAQGTQAPLITVPPASIGTWVDLGHVSAPWLAGDSPVPVTGPNAPTRVAGWRREDGRLLAIVIVQTAPSTGAQCPVAMHQEVVPGADGRCLRMRRNADFDGWMVRQNSVLAEWLDSRGWTSVPRAWVAYRVPGEGGVALEAHALFDGSLIEPVTRNSTDFLAAGAPGTQWARQFAAAVRAAGTSGRLAVPQFPYGPRVGLAPAPAPTVAAPPARATQVTPPVPARAPVAPRADRE